MLPRVIDGFASCFVAAADRSASVPGFARRAEAALRCGRAHADCEQARGRESPSACSGADIRARAPPAPRVLRARANGLRLVVLRRVLERARARRARRAATAL